MEEGESLGASFMGKPHEKAAWLKLVTNKKENKKMCAGKVRRLL